MNGRSCLAPIHFAEPFARALAASSNVPPMNVATIVDAEAQFAQAVMVRRRQAPIRQRRYADTLLHTGVPNSFDPLLVQRLGGHMPSRHLGVPLGRGAVYLAQLIAAIDVELRQSRPDAVVAYADTPATLATAIVAAQLDIPLIHVEAGERIFRRREIPEEMQRVLTDHASWLCLTSTNRSALYLRREGMAPDRVRFVGDPTYDLFRFARTHVDRDATVLPDAYGLRANEYHLATVHSTRNTSRPALLLQLMDALDRSALPVLVPVHPRVRALLDDSGWTPQGALRLIPPLGYFDFVAMLLGARTIVTDSGRVAREAFFALRPAIIPLADVWWPEIAEAGWAIQTGEDMQALREQMATYMPPDAAPEGLFGDGHSAARIVQEIERFLNVPRNREGPFHLHGAFEQLPKATASTFTYRSYRRMLRTLLDAGYSFRAFDETADANEPFVLLRHDIDLDLRKALRMAEIEAELGVTSSYFILVRTEHYNVFSAEQSELLRRILALGHYLGLHFDCAAYPEALSAAELAAACARERELLEAWFDHPVTIVSFHRPSAMVLTGDPDLSAPVPHTYMTRFTKDIRYCSDSRGRWQSGDPTSSEEFLARQPLHLLIHPIWWDERPVSPYECLLQYVDGKHTSLEQSIARNSTAYRVGWLGEAVEGLR